MLHGPASVWRSIGRSARAACPRSAEVAERSQAAAVCAVGKADPQALGQPLGRASEICGIRPHPAGSCSVPWAFEIAHRKGDFLWGSALCSSPFRRPLSDGSGRGLGGSETEVRVPRRGGGIQTSCRQVCGHFRQRTRVDQRPEPPSEGRFGASQRWLSKARSAPTTVRLLYDVSASMESFLAF